MRRSRPTGTAAPAKFPFAEAFRRIRRAVAPYPRAMLFELRARGLGDPFSQLVACLISIRTLDEVSLPVALRVLGRAPTASALARVPVAELTRLLRPATFARQKAERLLAIARAPGDLCSEEGLLALPGVGPKCAHLVLGIACEQAWIGVDVHVHRVTNRWGVVAASSPEKTELALREVLPRRYWVTINELLVPFGKHVCTGARPRCSVCPVARWCARVGVVNSR